MHFVNDGSVFVGQRGAARRPTRLPAPDAGPDVLFIGGVARGEGGEVGCFLPSLSLCAGGLLKSTSQSLVVKALTTTARLTRGSVWQAEPPPLPPLFSLPY